VLDSETKRKIDTLRNILVGKIPNPQSQVEQITTGLIYKFMNDMDEESIELGGSASFFVGDYEKYSWNNLFDSKLGGVDRVNLYSEAIESMYFNPSAPQLFRDIFKNAFLPFKDPSTLNMFLKEIDEFHYSHSEKLGDAFEYLISIMGSQGDAGQFRTPRHIIDFIVEIVNPQKDETILDPACGTAGFLISSYKHILKSNTNNKLGDQLSAEDRKKVGDNLSGYDISPEMVRLSLVNMYLHGFNTPKVDEYDTLSSEDKWNEYYDVILANPPFFSPKGGIQPHKRFGVESKRAEVLFTSYILDHLKPNGRAGIIVPEGIISKNDKAYEELRKQLIQTSLIGVISLPSGVFQPYSNVKTSVLILDKEVHQKIDSIFFAKVENDGFSLGTLRNPIDKNDLPKLTSKFRSFCDKPNDCLTTITRENLLRSKGTSLSFHKDEETIQHSEFEYARLDEVSSILAGNPAPQDEKLFENGSFPFVRTSDVGKIKFGVINETRDSLNESGITRLTKFKKGSILFPKSGASTLLNHRVMLGMDAYVASHLAVIKADEDKMLDQFLSYMLFHVDSAKIVNDPSYPSLNLSKIKNISIPNPTLNIQQEIVNELEVYQKIIDGCKQVIENCKATISIDPSWDMVELEDEIDFVSGVTLSVPNSLDNSGIPIITMADISSDGELNTSKIRKVNTGKKKYSLCEKGDLLFNWRNGSTHLVGKTAYFDLKGDYIFASFCQGIRVRKRLDSYYLWIILNQFRRQGVYLDKMRVMVNGVFNREEIKFLKVPLPSIEIQKFLAEKVKEEMKIVNNNKKLIEIYAQKIQNRINKVWSE
jgi:type I restriction enzyme M protein